MLLSERVMVRLMKNTARKRNSVPQEADGKPQTVVKASVFDVEADARHIGAEHCTHEER